MYQSLFCFTRYCDRSSRQISSSNHVTNRTNNAKRPWTLARYTTHRASLPSPVNSQANIMATNQSHDQRQDTMDTREVHNPPSATNDTEHSRHTRTNAIHTRQRATRLSRSAGPSNSIKKQNSDETSKWNTCKDTLYGQLNEHENINTPSTPKLACLQNENPCSQTQQCA